MRFKPSLNLSLRTRFILATVAVVLVPLSGFIFAIDNFTDSYEQLVLHGQLNRAMAQFEQAYAANPNTPAPRSELMQGYIVKPGQTPTLPKGLEKLRPGQNKVIDINGNEFNVSRRDVAGAQLYLVLDVALIEDFEDEVKMLAWTCGISALVFAVLVAFLLSSLVLSPVKRLAQRVSAIQPGQTRPNLMTLNEDRELGIIAKAFDHVLDRFDAFAMREKIFTEDASHELRTPLAIVMTGAELLADDETLSSKSRTRLNRIQMAAAQMHQLIEALLFLGREDGGGIDRSCSVGEVLEQAVMAYNETITKDTAALQLHIQQDYSVQAPRGMVLTIVNNLLRNAVEHGHCGSIDVTLTNHSLVVADTGSGIEASELPHIFEHHSKGLQSHGQGLGLSIVKRICDRLKWRIEVQSAPGQGTRFELIF